MAHQNTDSEDATAQNAATDPQMPGDQPRPHRPAPSAYVAPSSKDATLAGPAAGEVGDYADEGEEIDHSLGEVQEGGNHRDRNLHAHDDEQGSKTRAANRVLSKSGSSDQGTH